MLGSSNAVNFGTTASAKANFTFDAGTSLLDIGVNNLNFQGNGQTFYDVALTGAGNINTTSISGDNTFNNLSIVGRSTAGISNRTISGNQTINGTLTLSAGTNATMRTFVRSSIIGTTRTLTCAAVASLTDIDFRDITIAGAAVSGGNLTGTRLGDCKGNSGITFVAGANKYWNLPGNGNWSSTVWATSSGGAVSNDNFPLAQDTCIFEAGSPNSGNTATINSTYNIGTIDMSARTTNTMTLACAQSPSIYGNWTNGTGVTLSGTGTLTFAGRGSQTLTSAGATFTQLFTINTLGGSVTLQDAFQTNSNSAFALDLQSGTPSASAKTFSIGANTSSFSGLTINQGGAGQLNLNGNNSFANITNTYSATGATTISFSTTTQRVANFTATGTAGNVLTIQGAASPCTLIHTGAGEISLDYLNLIGVRAYQI
jgi:fibronectin-binding autotransporter adhesin